MTFQDGEIMAEFASQGNEINENPEEEGSLYLSDMIEEDGENLEELDFNHE